MSIELLYIPRVISLFHISSLFFRALWELKPGESIEMKGPFPKLAYKANDYDAIGMIAGGTGITPMYQVLLEILKCVPSRLSTLPSF